VLEVVELEERAGRVTSAYTRGAKPETEKERVAALFILLKEVVTQIDKDTGDSVAQHVKDIVAKAGVTP